MRLASPPPYDLPMTHTPPTPPRDQATPPGAAGHGRWAATRRRWQERRAALEHRPHLRRAWKVGVAVIGVLVIVVGLVLVPLPGPGWLIVFLGVALLGTEFPAAHRITQWVRGLVHKARLRWRAWRVARAARSARVSATD